MRTPPRLPLKVGEQVRIGMLVLVCVLSSVVSGFAQNEYKGSSLYRAKNYMNGNLIRSVFYNYGLVGNIGEISGEWPIGTGNEYVGDVSPLVGIEFTHTNGDTLHSVTTSDGPRGNPDGPGGGGRFWGFEPLPGFAASARSGEDPAVAVSNDTTTWPDFWPDKQYNDVRDRNWRRDDTDPGWPGSWNGYFGKNVFSADQETYFQMDDQADEEWFERILENNPDTAAFWDPLEPARGQSIRVTYDAVKGTLPDDIGAVYLQWGVDESSHDRWRPPPVELWPSGSTPIDSAIRSPMTNLGGGRFEITLATGSNISSLHLTFSDGGELLDDNYHENWNIFLDGGERSYFYYPSREDSTRRGLGLRVAVRGLQWAHFLAQDCIFWLYEITNISSYAFDKATFGMIVGTLCGGRQDSRDDLAQFILESDITYSYDGDDAGSPGWVPVRPGEINVGYVGYAFLESPGNPFDGIDNDGDDTSGTAPVFDRNLLEILTDTIVFSPGDPIVLIDYDTYERTVSTFPASGRLEWDLRGETRHVNAGDSILEDGTNGIDDNFNGLIDERNDTTLVGLRYVDYFTGAGLNDAMLDEARDDGIDNDGDWDFKKDDVGADGVGGTRDFGENNGFPTVGEPNFDRTDVDESDQIGLTAFEYFSPPGAVRMRDDPGLWVRMEPGRVDTVNPTPEDGDFIYGSGYFPLQPGQTERFSMALLYGEDLPDIEDNEATVQQIYDENYNFARPPEKPTVFAVPGDGKVTLYWDGTKSEASEDPICKCNDFEGYKIYRSTDPSFNEVFSVTDGLGRKVFHRPIAQFDYKDNYAYVDSSYFMDIDPVKCDSFQQLPDTAWHYIYCYADTFLCDSLQHLPDTTWHYVYCPVVDSLVRDSAAVGIKGFFPIIRNSVIYYLGDNTGLVHSWTDNTVENGQTYYYAVCAYDRGDLVREILPSENTKAISVDLAGNVTLDVNCVQVTPRAPAAGYTGPVTSPARHVAGRATGTGAVELLDPLKVPDNATYEITFHYVPDTLLTDSLPGDSLPPDTTFRELFGYTIGRDRGGLIDTAIRFEQIATVPSLRSQAVQFGAYYDSLFNLPPGTYPAADHFDVGVTSIYDGQRIYYLVPRDTSLISEYSGWADTTHHQYAFTFEKYRDPVVFLEGTRLPADYQIDWFGENEIVDTSAYLNYYDLVIFDPIPVNFTVRNLTIDEPIDFLLSEVDSTENGRIDPGETIIFYEHTTTPAGQDTQVVTWFVKFSYSLSGADTAAPADGDELFLSVYQGYSPADVYQYTTRAARVDPGAVKLDRIKVYPNPYLAASGQEPLNPYEEGRGERRITFIHLPDRCTIRLYTVRGDLVKTIEHHSSIDDGTENWDLRSKDGLNVAYGVYLYHVDSPYGERTGRFAVIK